jgi:hypothetical protein
LPARYCPPDIARHTVLHRSYQHLLRQTSHGMFVMWRAMSCRPLGAGGDRRGERAEQCHRRRGRPCSRSRAVQVESSWTPY